MQKYKTINKPPKPLNKDFEKSRLDNNRGLVLQPYYERPHDVKKTEQYFDNYNRTKFAKTILTSIELEKLTINPQKLFAHQYCGCHTTSQDYPIREKNGKYYIGNLAMCKNIHRCPSCTIKLLKQKEIQIIHYVKSHLAQGKTIAFATFTQQTNKTQTSRELRLQLKKNLKRFRNSRYYQTLNTKVITNTETTYTNYHNGHHHSHELWFFETKDQEQIKNHKNSVISKWCNLTGANQKAQDYQVLTPDNLEEKLLHYFAKSISQEMTNTFNKKGRESYNFLELATLGAKNQIKNVKIFGAKTKQESHKIICALMQSDIEATKGTQKIHISKYISSQYPIEEETEEQKLAEQLKIKDTVILSYQALKLVLAFHIKPNILNLCSENHEEKKEIRQQLVLNEIRSFDQNYGLLTNSDNKKIICLKSEIQFYE